MATSGIFSFGFGPGASPANVVTFGFTSSASVTADSPIYNIEKESQKLLVGKKVELFEFDATNLDGSTLYRFCSSYKESGDVLWQGEIYTAIPIAVSGVEKSSTGPFPTLNLRIDNIGLLPAALIASLGDPLGATVTRWLTFSDFLDDGPRADPNQHYPPEIFVVERKVFQTKLAVEFELSASIDAEGVELPFRLVLRDACTHVYRRWDDDSLPGGAFDYSDATCPYAGSDGVPGDTESPYFKQNGDSTTEPILDVCGKRLTDCESRFGIDPLPFNGFPGVARIR
jgi:lambda family phage minor tail protein L